MKERCRAIFAATPCALSIKLLIALVKFVVSRINLLPVLGSRSTPHSWHRLSPHELLTGIKTSYARDLRVGFLDYAQLTEPVNETTHNTLKPRTRGGVALYPLGNSKGSVKFMALDSGVEVVREKFHVLPMPDIVILHLNAMASKDKKTISKDPAFLYHGRPIEQDPDTDPAQEDDCFRPIATDPSPLRLAERDPEDLRDAPAEIEEWFNPQGEIEDKIRGEHNPNVEIDDEIGGDHRNGGSDQPKLSDFHTKAGSETVTQDDSITNLVVVPKPKVTFLREPYMLRNRKPANTLLTVTTDKDTQHAYNISIKGALKTHGDAALSALLTECTSLLSKSTFHPIAKKTLTEDQVKSVIRSSCFLKVKSTPDGIFEKLKARIVAGGDQQDKSIYTIDETSSPTVSAAAVFVTVAIAAHQRRHVMTMDVEAAYLNAKMIEGKPVFMRIDPLITAILTQLDATYEHFRDSKGSVIVKLDRALYGCVESAVLWYKDLRETLEADEYTVNPYDLCVFNKVYSNEQVTVIFHVDDLLSTCVLQAALEELYKMMIRKYKKVKVTRGLRHHYLGMVTDFSVPGEVTISTPGYMADLLRDYEVNAIATTPADENLFSLRESPPLSTAESKRFHSFVAKLLYLSKRTRPDILTLVAFLTTRVQGPTEDDKVKLDRGMKYLNGTRDLTLTLRVEGPIRITAYVDASFATHYSDMKSHTGVYITLGLGAIYCRSSKQKLVTKSSTEAELVGISDALPQIIWFKHFLEAQGHPPAPAHIWEDNESTICLAKTGRSCSERSRHIEIRYFWIHDYLASGKVTMTHMHTDKMIADMFTKPLQGSKFKSFRHLCLNEK